uniref:Uncharacterized protein n=1 Tax=Red panda feces-associated circular DNA virus 19 TaxID=2863972 RepID=A0A8K1HH81_9VIRU|nr:hypothetical protein [Red panda feces-associated circular DNA virus 19]
MNNRTTRDMLKLIISNQGEEWFHQHMWTRPICRDYIEIGDGLEVEHLYCAQSYIKDWVMAKDYFKKQSSFRADYPSCTCIHRGLGGASNPEAWDEANEASSFRHWVLHQSANYGINFNLDNWSEDTFRDLIDEETAWANKKSGIGYITQPNTWSIPKLFLVKDSECYQQNISREVYELTCDGIDLGGVINCSNCDQSLGKMWCFTIWGNAKYEPNSVYVCGDCKEQFERCSKCSDETHGEQMHGDLYHFNHFEKRLLSIKNARTRQVCNNSDLEPFNDERAMILS